MMALRPPSMLPSLRPRRGNRGVILVLVLWMVIVLSLIAYSVLFQVTMEISVTSARKKHLRAESLARAGLARAIIDLKNDAIFDTAEEATKFDAEGDVWARPEEGKDEFYLADEVFDGEEEDGYFSVRVYDVNGLFNLNTMSQGNAKLLETIVQEIGYNEDDAKLVTQAIIDWRDRDFQTALPAAPSPEEGITYAIFNAEDVGGDTDPDEIEPMILRNENYLTVDELLEVYGVTPDLYFGPGTPEAEHYKRVFGEKVYDQDRFEVEEQRSRRRRDEPILGLRDYFTVNSSGNLNLNTAPEHVLDALAIASGVGDEGWGETVIKTRRGGRDDDIDNEDAFEDSTAIMANVEIAGVVAVGRNLHPIGVETNVFRIVSYGVVGGVKSRLEAQVHRDMITMQRSEDFEINERAEERRDRNEGRYERRESTEGERVVNYPFVRITQMYRE